MLQTFDTTASGPDVPMLRVGDLVYKFAGVASVGWSYTGGTQSGQINDDRFTRYPGCEPFAFVIDAAFDSRGGGVILSISGNTLTWSYPVGAATQQNRPNATFVYGIF